MNPISTILRVSLPAVPLGMTLVAGVAQAAPGEGIPLGAATTLQPDVDLGLLYRSNITQSADGGAGGVSFTLAPGSRLIHETPDTRFQARGDYRLVKFFSRRLSAADQFNDFDISMEGEFLRTRPVGFVTKARTALVNNNADRLGNTPFHTRFRATGEAGLQLRPGPVLQFDVRGNFEYDNFRVPVGAQLGDGRGFNSRFGYGGVLHGEWRFFPRTAFVLDVDVTNYDWNRNWIPEGDRGTFLAIPGSLHSRALAGLRGRFTDRIVVAGQLGYGAASYREQDVIDACTGTAECDPTNAANPFGADLRGFERLLVLAQLQYTIDEGRAVTVGYRKDFDDVFFTNYMAYNELYASFNSRLGTRFLTRVSGAVRQESYRGENQRGDVFFRAQGDLSYDIQDWVRATAGIGYIQRASQAVPYQDVQGRVLMTFRY